MRQFGRNYQLLLGNASESIEITGLRITFDVHKTLNSTPNPATIHIYNLNESHRNAITRRQFDRVSLAVGYQDVRIIYRGDIIASREIRQNLDFITAIECGDGFNDYVGAHVNTTLSVGATDSDIAAQALKAMVHTDGGLIALPNDRPLPRSKVLVGNARDVIDKIARNNQADWSVQDGQLMVLPKDCVLTDNDGFVLSQESGMVGSPEKTDRGLNVTCLLNPLLAVGALVRVQSILNGISGDYKITELTHAGDIMTSQWQTRIVCLNGQFKRANHAE